MATQTIESPGVQINEIDLSLRAVVPNGTNVLVLGFANQGPTEEVIEIPDIQTFETIYATPTNAAERYFYHSVRGVLNGGGRPLAARLPYGDGTGAGTSTKYSCLAYPAIPFQQTLQTESPSIATFSQEQSGYFIGAPTYFELTESQYQDIVQGNIGWVDTYPTALTQGVSGRNFETFANLASAGLIVLNKFKSTFDSKTFEGYGFGICDSFDTNPDPSTDFNCVSAINYSPLNATRIPNATLEFSKIPSERLNFDLTSTVNSNKPSVSRNIEQQGSNISLYQSLYIDSVSVKVLKLRQSIYTPNALTLDYTMPDGFLGSFNSFRKIQDQNGGQPIGFFIGDVDDGSTYVQVIVNPNISSTAGDWTNNYGNPGKFICVHHGNADTIAKIDTNVKANKAFINTVVYGAGVVAGATAFGGDFTTFLNQYVTPVDSVYSYGPTVLNNLSMSSGTYAPGNVPGKIDRVFQTIEDVDALRIDLSVEAGLGSVYASTKTLLLSAYDDTIPVNIGTLQAGSWTGLYRINGDLSTDNLNTTVPGVAVPEDYTAEELKNNYLAVYEQFRVFAQSVRKDHMFIADPYRPIFVTGARQKNLADKSKTFVQNIVTPMKNLYDTSSTSFAAVYANWALANDLSSGQNVWIPASGLIAGMMAQDDANFAPWYAPAGFTRGKFPSPVLDIAVTPSQRNRDLLYKIGLNPITKFPNDGITVFGQKTKLATPSAFDRINVRRLFLYLEKLTRSTLKYFVFEPNTLFTRTNVINVLKPQFDIVKNNQGMYDYLIVCDERNNTPEVIDQNQLIVDIYIKPTRAAEFILVNFYATRTDQDFNELI